MTDDTIETTADSTIKPAEQPAPEPVKAAKPEPKPAVPIAESFTDVLHAMESKEAPTAKEKLRAFEEATFGPDVVRVNDQVERGRGSPFAEMDDDKRKHYQALENLIEAESKVADTSAALASAEAAHEAALAAVAARENDASGES